MSNRVIKSAKRETVETFKHSKVLTYYSVQSTGSTIKQMDKNRVGKAA